MKPVRIELDHFRRSRQPARASWLLLAIALAFTGDVGYNFINTRANIAAQETRLAQLSGNRPSNNGIAAVTSQPESQEELIAARDTVLRLSTPWSNVFRALEATQSDEIALLSIEPDVQAGSLTLTGESKSYPAVLTYVAWLSKEKTLRDVHLAKHEARQSDPQRPLFFTISANWKEGH